MEICALNPEINSIDNFNCVTPRIMNHGYADVADSKNQAEHDKRDEGKGRILVPWQNLFYSPLSRLRYVQLLHPAEKYPYGATLPQ